MEKEKDSFDTVVTFVARFLSEEDALNYQRTHPGTVIKKVSSSFSSLTTYYVFMEKC